MSWHLGPMTAFDTETTGVDVENDRIVSAAVIAMDNGLASATTWLADPGIDIPTQASDIHHITTEHARAHGRPAKDVVAEVIAALAGSVKAGVPLVGHNIAYDLTLTDREARRHLGTGLYEALGGEPLVIDTMVLDRFAAPFRKRVSEKQGPYQMRTTAETYGLPWNEEAAHGAEYDAFMSGRVAWRIGQIAHTPRADRPDWVRRLRTKRFDQLRGMGLAELHKSQVTWARLDAENYQKWLRNPEKAGKKYDPNAVIDGSWPLIPAAAGEPDAEAVNA